MSSWIWRHVIWYSVTGAKPIFIVTLVHAVETRTDMVTLRYIRRKVNYKENQNTDTNIIPKHRKWGR